MLSLRSSLVVLRARKLPIYVPSATLNHLNVAFIKLYVQRKKFPSLRLSLTLDAESASSTLYLTQLTVTSKTMVKVTQLVLQYLRHEEEKQLFVVTTLLQYNIVEN